jgi:hypothetical protein
MLIEHLDVKVQFLNILSCTVSVMYSDIECRYLGFPPECQNHRSLDVAFWEYLKPYRPGITPRTV